MRADRPGERSRLSVIIPAFNLQDWLGGTLDSVLSQDVPPTEVIVVDDGSTDRTGSVAASFGPAVKVLKQENAGLSAARNAGAATSSGDVLLFLDGDDRLLPGTIARSLSALRNHPHAGLCVPNHRFGSSGPLAWTDLPELRELRRRDLNHLLRRNWLFANAFVRRFVWATHRYDESLRAVEDLEFYARLLLDDVPILFAGSLGVEMAVRRPGSLTSGTKLMRRARHEVFKKLISDPRLESSERLTLVYQLGRTRVGVILARDRSIAPVPSRGAVVYVLLDEPGGAPRHVRDLQAGLQNRFAFRTARLASRDLRLNPFGWWRAIRRLRPALTGARLIHVFGVRASAVVALAGRPVNRVPRIVTVLGLHSLRRATPIKRAALEFLNKRALSSFDRVIVHGPSDRTTVVERDLAPIHSVALVVPGIEFPPDGASAAKISTQHLRILWAGRFVAQKDPLTFVRVARNLSEVDAEWIMAGDGELLQRCKEEAPPFLRFVGWQQDVWGLLNDADLFVSTALWEGFPFALMEAAVVGVPIVATDVAGNRDLAQVGVPLSLASAGNVGAIADAIRMFLKDVDASRRRGSEARDAARAAFSIERMLEETAAMYADLLSQEG